MWPLLTPTTSEGAQGITFLKSEFSNKKDEVCYGFLDDIFTKYLLTGGVHCVILPFQVLQKETSNAVENLTADSSQKFITTATFCYTFSNLNLFSFV